MASLWLIQTLYYPREPGQRTSTFNRVVMTTYGLVVVFNALRLWSGTESLYGFVSVLSLFKLYVSVGKYVPQVGLFVDLDCLWSAEKGGECILMTRPCSGTIGMGELQASVDGRLVDRDGYAGFQRRVVILVRHDLAFL